MKKNLSIDDIVELSKHKDWKLSITRQDSTIIDIQLTKVYRKCFICEKKLHVDSMQVRQHSKVTELNLPKWVCNKDAYQIDYLTSIMK